MTHTKDVASREEEDAENTTLTEKQVLRRAYHKIRMNRLRKEAPWRITFEWIKGRCSVKNNQVYSKLGIKCRITLMELKYLWIRDCASKMKHPSIDRINPFGHYEINNCRFVEMHENRRTKRIVSRKRVCAISSDGKIAGKFSSIRDANEWLGSSDSRGGALVNHLKGRRATYYGYTWKYL